VKRDLDTDRIDDAVLALLHLTLHDGRRAWKGFDWDALDRLHEKGLIDDPKYRNESVVFTEEGLRRSEELFRQLFTKPEGATGRAVGKDPVTDQPRLGGDPSRAAKTRSSRDDAGDVRPVS